MRWLLLGLLGLMACGNDEDSSIPEGDDDDDGACGAITEHDVSVTGVVHLDGAPVEGVEVRLEERNWHPGLKVFGSGLTDADGLFSFDALGVVSVEGCWGTAVDYWVAAVDGDRSAEEDVNHGLYNAIFVGPAVLDISSFPLEL